MKIYKKYGYRTIDVIKENPYRLAEDINGIGFKIADRIAFSMGIPEESQPHIFERFYRVDKARSRSTGGSGLGLSIVRNLVERNHGRIQVISTIGQGTEFTITFPVVELQEEGL